MAERTEGVDRQRLVEDVAEQRLQPAEALAAGAARIALDRAVLRIEVASTIDRFCASSGVGFANSFRSETVGSAASTAVLPVTDACPSDLIAGIAECENAGRFVKNRSSWPEAAFRFASTGVLATTVFSERGHRRTQLLEQWRQVLDRQPQVVCPGSRSRSRSGWPSSTNRSTCELLLASAVITLLESCVRFWSVVESLASRWSRLSVSVSAGTARRNAAWRSSDRAAAAAPSSLTISVKRSRYGSRMTSWSRSAGIVDCVWVTGIVLPGLSTGPLLVPGSQSMKYSPISDSGRDWQKAFW